MLIECKALSESLCAICFTKNWNQILMAFILVSTLYNRPNQKRDLKAISHKYVAKKMTLECYSFAWSYTHTHTTCWSSTNSNNFTSQKNHMTSFRIIIYFPSTCCLWIPLRSDKPNPFFYRENVSGSGKYELKMSTKTEQNTHSHIVCVKSKKLRNQQYQMYKSFLST